MRVEEIKERYPYLYETHLHTSNASACGKSTGTQMAEAAAAYGYTGIFVTDHNWGGNTCIDRALPWEDHVHLFCQGYETAKARGKELGLDVFFGYEAGFNATEFLIYGVDEAWMASHPELRTADIPTHYELVKSAGGFSVHAHPYREEFYIPEIRLFPQYTDAVEGINATHANSRSTSHNDPAFDTKAIAYAREHGFPMTAGSDIHNVNLFGGGVAFAQKISSPQEYIKAIRDGADYVLTNGEKWFDKYGNVMVE